VYKIDLGTINEPVRTESSVIIANGVPVEAGQKLAFSFSQGGVEIVIVRGIGSHMVVERSLKPGLYDVEIRDEANNASLYIGQLELKPASIGLLVRSDNGTIEGSTRITVLRHQDIPAVVAVNASSDPNLSLIGGTQDPYTVATVVPTEEMVQLPVSTTATVSFFVASKLPGISGKLVSTFNNPGHRLIYFFLGNNRVSDISLVTVPLEPASLAAFEPTLQHPSGAWCEGEFVCEAVPSHICPTCAKQCLPAPQGVCSPGANGGFGQKWSGSYDIKPLWSEVR
jgi:hypothetical protein